MAVTKFKSFKRLVLIKAAIVKQLSSFFRRQDVISERPQRIGSGPELRLHRRLPDHLDRHPDVRTNFQMINETLQEQPREFFPRKSRRLSWVSSSSAWMFLLFFFGFEIPAARFKPGTAGYKARKLPLCYDVPHLAVNPQFLNFNLHFSHCVVQSHTV